jgi:hypothetical protein
MKALSILGVVFGVMFGRVAYLYLESRAAYMRRARPSSALKRTSERNGENIDVSILSTRALNSPSGADRLGVTQLG